MGIEVFSRAIAVGGKSVPNRFVVLPTEGNDSDADGAPTARTIERYVNHARGGAGIVFMEAVAISRDARARISQPTLSDKTLEAYKTLVKDFRSANPDALFMIQLDHAGALSDSVFAKPVFVYDKPGACTVLTDDEIAGLRDGFIKCIILAADAGFDGAELKFAHGFLGNDFIDPANQRPGKYGSSFANRTRFFSEIVEGARRALDARNFILGVRFSAYNGLPKGFGSSGVDGSVEDMDEPLRFVTLAEQLGCGIISVSAGSAAGNLDILLPGTAYAEGCLRHFRLTSRVKHAVRIPVIGAGYSRIAHSGLQGHDLLYWAGKNMSDGNVDLIGLGRQAIADAAYPDKVLAGKADTVKVCTTCAGCGMLLGDQKNVGCTLYDEYYKELSKARK